MSLPASSDGGGVSPPRGNSHSAGGDTRPPTGDREPPEEDVPGVPGFRSWRAVYWFVFASFVAVVVALTILSRIYA